MRIIKIQERNCDKRSDPQATVKNNRPLLEAGGGYFFMDKTSNNIKVNTIIMYSIVLTPFLDHSEKKQSKESLRTNRLPYYAALSGHWLSPLQELIIHNVSDFVNRLSAIPTLLTIHQTVL